jgi:hypothetical protein
VRTSLFALAHFRSSAAKPPYLNKIRRRLWLAPIISKGKKMRKTLGVSLLVLLLTGSARAGIMQNDAPASPPPQPASAAQEPTANGWIQNESADSLTQTVFDLLAALPSLL